MYVGTAMNGRRGAVINAIGALDIALHDLRGKALKQSVAEMYGGRVRDRIMGYAAAMSWTVFAIILVITLVQFRLQKRWVQGD